MSSRSFSLKPFLSAGLLPHLSISGSIERHSNILAVSYILTGHLADVVVPPPSDPPARKQSLWEGTCFEFFLGVRDSDRYREFNLSPAGHWNVYCFRSYREGMQEEPAFTSLPFRVAMHQDSLRLSLEFGLDRIMPSEQTLEVAVSAVIKTSEGKLTCWALTHTGPQPDFHRRESFLITL